jgi:hypothetical protein
MKNFAKALTSLVVAGGFMFLAGCTTEDTSSPVVTLNGDANVVVIYKSATSYTDPGATATDAEDGNLTVVTSGTVNMSSAGTYTLTYTATDKAGNVGTATREVIVDAAPYVAGDYTLTDVSTTTTTGTDAITAVSGTPNKICIHRFANYDDGVMYATLEGSSIYVIGATVTCGTSPDIAPRTFQGTGSSSFTATGMVINYSETTNGTTVNGTTTYVKI